MVGAQLDRAGCGGFGCVGVCVFSLLLLLLFSGRFVLVAGG